MNNYKKLLHEVCKSKNLTLMQGVHFLANASQTMRRSKLLLDSENMSLLLNFMEIPEGWTEALWELTETPHKIMFIGSTPDSVSFGMSISVECSLDELEKFYKLVQKTITITGSRITEVCDR